MGECFLSKFTQKKGEVIDILGPRRALQIEVFARREEIYRITELLNMPGIGDKTIEKLSKIMGYRFAYDVNKDICYRNKKC
jgi:hypothetical protein